jgi:hypothetical protein
LRCYSDLPGIQSVLFTVSSVEKHLEEYFLQL